MGNAVNLLRYLWEISRELPGNWKQKKKILSIIKHSIQDYLSDGEEISYRQIKERFGEPKQIARSYVESMETEEVVKEIKTSQKIIKIITAAVISAVVLWGGYITLCYINFQDSMNGYIIVEVTEIEQTTIDEGE